MSDQTPGALHVEGFADVNPIGHGAFATVYRAVELGTDRPVALKLLNVGSMPRHLIEDFHAEVRALAAVSSHPNIVTMYRGVALPDGRPVLVLELCRGSYLQRVQALGPLDPGEVVSVGIKVAGALETAHRAGYLHRDVKPQNILVTQFGEPALADFGVAMLAASALATEASSGFTTLHAAPEILEGHPLSPATDVYSLASTMYQILTGRPPFSAFEGQSPASAILRILHEPPAPITRYGVPISLSDALVRGLEKDPVDRPFSAASFADVLRDVEREAGWPLTPYVVWGDEPATPAATGPIWTPPSSEALPGDAPPTYSSEVSTPGDSPSPSPSAVPGVLVPQVGARRVIDPTAPVPPSASDSARPPTLGPARPTVPDLPLPPDEAPPSTAPSVPPALPTPVLDAASFAAAPPPEDPSLPTAPVPPARFSMPPPPPAASGGLPAPPPAPPPATDAGPTRDMVSTGWPDRRPSTPTTRAPGPSTWAPSVPAGSLEQTAIPSLIETGPRAATGPAPAPPAGAAPGTSRTTALIVAGLAAATVVIVLIVLALAGLL